MANALLAGEVPRASPRAEAPHVGDVFRAIERHAALDTLTFDNSMAAPVSGNLNPALVVRNQIPTATPAVARMAGGNEIRGGVIGFGAVQVVDHERTLARPPKGKPINLCPAMVARVWPRTDLLKQNEAMARDGSVVRCERVLRQIDVPVQAIPGLPHLGFRGTSAGAKTAITPPQMHWVGREGRPANFAVPLYRHNLIVPQEVH